MTDVNIATEMLADAFDNLYDTALLISGDSDLVPPVTAILRRFPGKRVVIAFPPCRHSLQLENAAFCKFTIGRASLKKSPFPDQLRSASGYTLRRPSKWA